MARSRRQERASRRRSLVTPEGVDLGVTLADAGTRAAAFLLDAVLIMLAGIVITLVALMGFGGMGFERGEPIAVVWIVLVFFLRYLGEVATAVSSIKGYGEGKKKELYGQLLGVAKRKTAVADTQMDDRGKKKAEPAVEDFGENVLIVDTEQNGQEN